LDNLFDLYLHSLGIRGSSTVGAQAAASRRWPGTAVAWQGEDMTMTELETLPEIRGWLLVSPGEKPGRLSPRERQILDMITAGRTQKEVAYDLGVSDATVRVLYARAMKKLGRRRSRRPREIRT